MTSQDRHGERPWRTIGVRMHGVRLNVHCDYEPLLEHTRCLLDSHTCPPWPEPDLEVNAWWLTRAADEQPSPFDAVEDLDGFGKRMFLGRDQLVWPDTHRNRDLQLRFGRRGSTTVFDVAYRFAPKQSKLEKYPDYEQKKFFDVLRYLVMFPVAWHLERTRGWVMVHASAVADGNGAILIAGPGGAGKTTTCVALMARAGLALLTENLLFWDGEVVYPVFEPIRLTDESLRLLGDAARHLEGFSSPGALKKKSMFLPPAAALPSAVPPVALFLPQFAAENFVRRMDRGIANELLVATNRLTLELNDYYWYSAALDVLWPKPGSAAAHLETLERLSQRTPCYAMGINRAAGVAPVVDQILSCVQGQLQGVGERES